MYSPGKLLYITDYDFGVDHDNRNKYLIVIHNIDGLAILVALTTSVCHIPDALLKSGCIQEVTSNIHSFHFPKGMIIAKNGYCFEQDTFVDINRSQVFERPIEHMNTKYYEKGLTQEICELLEDHYYELLYCIYKS